MIESDGVYIYEVQQLEDGGEARGIVGNHARLTLTATDGVVTAVYVDWQGDPMTDEVSPILVSVTGAVTQELTLTPVGGQITFDLPPIGCVVTVTTNFPCDVATLRT